MARKTWEKAAVGEAAPAFDRALVGEAAHHLAQRRAIGVLQPEGARDLAHAGLAFVRADEGEDILSGGKAAGLLLFDRFFQGAMRLGAMRRVRQPGAARFSRAKPLKNKGIVMNGYLN